MIIELTSKLNSSVVIDIPIIRKPASSAPKLKKLMKEDF